MNLRIIEQPKEDITSKTKPKISDNPKCLFVIQCVAELLDILKPRKTDIPRMMKISDFLKMKRLLLQ